MKPILTPDDLAERWQVTRSQLGNMRHSGKGPEFFKPNARTVRYRLEDVEAFEAKTRTMSERGVA